MALWEPTIYLILLIILQYEAVATGGECSYCKNWHRGNNSAELCFFQGSNFITVGCKNSVSMRNRMQEVSICHLLGKQDENDERGYDCFKVYMLEEDKCIFITVFNLKVPPLRRVNHLNANDMFGCLCYPNEYLRVSEFGFRVVVRRFLHLKLKRSKRSCRYYSNSCSTFNVLLKAGDIEMNPGPSAPKCSICEKWCVKICEDLFVRYARMCLMLIVQKLHGLSRFGLTTHILGHVQTVLYQFCPLTPWIGKLLWRQYQRKNQMSVKASFHIMTRTFIYNT